MKRILIGILIFLVYLALVIWLGFALHFEGMRLALFCGILGLLGALATIFILWYMHKVSKASGQSSGPDTPDAINLSALLRDADARIRQAGRAGAKSLAALPLIYVVGDENSAKTQTVLQSGLERLSRWSGRSHAASQCVAGRQLRPRGSRGRAAASAAALGEVAEGHDSRAAWLGLWR